MNTANAQLAHRGADALSKRRPVAGELARLHAGIEAMAPEILARAPETESARRVPADIIDRLRQLGAFRALLPRSHGGLELSLPEVLPVIEALSAADGSVGWLVLIGITSQLFSTRLPRQTFDRIFIEQPDLLLAGSGIPVGKAEMVDGGYRVSGRWPFVSGCQNAQWIGGLCVIHKDGVPLMSDAGPVARSALAAAKQWRIEDTWQASGLAGTGSHHVSLDNVFVAEAATFDAFGGPSCLSGPFGGPFAPFIGPLHSAVATGIATGAVADLVAMTGSGRRQLFAAGDLRDSAIFQHEFGRLGAALRASQALMGVQAEHQWDRASAGLLDDKVDLTESLQSSAWIHATCTDVVSGCYTLGGASAIHNSSPLQRRLRDLHVARQHIFAHERFYGRAGANALGFPPVNPISGH